MKGTGWFLFGLLAKAHDFDDVDSQKAFYGSNILLAGVQFGHAPT